MSISLAGRSILCVLIDTYWNVNWELLSFLFPSSHVLIDTYWNVNELREECILDNGRFNRYILECK